MLKSLGRSAALTGLMCVSEQAQGPADLREHVKLVSRCSVSSRTEDGGSEKFLVQCGDCHQHAACEDGRQIGRLEQIDQKRVWKN